MLGCLNVQLVYQISSPTYVRVSNWWTNFSRATKHLETSSSLLTAMVLMSMDLRHMNKNPWPHPLSWIGGIPFLRLPGQNDSYSGLFDMWNGHISNNQLPLATPINDLTFVLVNSGPFLCSRHKWRMNWLKTSNCTDWNSNTSIDGVLSVTSPTHKVFDENITNTPTLSMSKCLFGGGNHTKAWYRGWGTNLLSRTSQTHHNDFPISPPT